MTQTKSEPTASELLQQRKLELQQALTQSQKTLTELQADVERLEYLAGREQMQLEHQGVLNRLDVEIEKLNQLTPELIELSRQYHQKFSEFYAVATHHNQLIDQLPIGLKSRSPVRFDKPINPGSVPFVVMRDSRWAIVTDYHRVETDGGEFCRNYGLEYPDLLKQIRGEK